MIAKCLAKINKDEPQMKYVVSPKFNEFEFNSFLKKNFPKMTESNFRKKETLDSLSWSEQDFEKARNVTNAKFLGKYNYNLPKLSNATISNYVISFSGVHENLIFGQITYYCNAVKPSDLNESYFSQNHKYMSADCINFVIKDDKITVINGNGISLEFQCSESDIQIEN
jgi:hypothetical protein